MQFPKNDLEVVEILREKYQRIFRKLIKDVELKMSLKSNVKISTF